MKKLLCLLPVSFASLFLGCTAAGEDTIVLPTPIQEESSANGSNTSSGNGSAASSVNDYSNLETAMAPNQNRGTVRAGGTTQVSVPSYMSGGGSATFSIHPDDAALAQITPQGQLTGKSIGNVRVIVSSGGETSTVVVSVAPSESFYTLPAGQTTTLANEESSSIYALPSDKASCVSEPTRQLAWCWRNPTQSYGLSGKPCGIDVLSYFVDPVSSSRGWVRTTFGFGGWHYDLNGITDGMTNGVQTAGNVKLELKPEFVYDNGVPYLQITHTLTNTGSAALSNQKFGASADVMLHGDDYAPLKSMPYGVLMSNERPNSKPTIKLRLICQNVKGVTDATTVWMGSYGDERKHIYEDQRKDFSNDDSALNFSYQNISLKAGESKKFVVRFTQVQ